MIELEPRQHGKRRSAPTACLCAAAQPPAHTTRPVPHPLLTHVQLANRLFGVEVVSADGEAPVWHKDVRFFKVRGGAVISNGRAYRIIRLRDTWRGSACI